MVSIKKLDTLLCSAACLVAKIVNNKIWVTRKEKLQWNVTKADIVHGDFTHVQFNFSDNFCLAHCYDASIVIFGIKFSPCTQKNFYIS